MATLYEQQQAQQQQQAQKQQLVSASVGAGVQTVGKIIGYSTDIWATLTSLIGGVSLGLSQFFSAQKTAKEQTQIAKNQQAITSAVDSFMSQLDQAGLDLIDQGLNPLTPQFETTLSNNLFQKIGYSGNCNATIWMPNTQPGSTNRQIWFQISNNGKVLVPTQSLQNPPINLQTYWTVKCNDVHDDWYNSYQNKLIIEGRNAELQAFQDALNKSSLIWQITFGSIITILVIVIFINMVRIK